LRLYNYNMRDTITKRFKTSNPNIVKVVIGVIGESNLIFAKSIYFEVDIDGEQVLAMDYESALMAIEDHGGQI